MRVKDDICLLDYLVGTLATAYRGMITSLVIKDFCMTEENGATIIYGTMLSMPEEGYQARFIHEGIVLSRSELEQGYFELTAETELIRQAKNLQIDIVQAGRHIGTFLLKKETAGGFFESALELSEDLKGVNLKALTSSLGGRVGLLGKAEQIVSKILSTKKDWKRLSEEINGFSTDLFWYDRDAYVRWYGALVRYAFNVCERLDIAAWDKALSNALSLVELPLEKEEDQGRLRFCVDIWLRQSNASTADFSYRLSHTGRVLEEIRRRFPDADVAPALKALLSSVTIRVKKTPTLSDSVLRAAREALPREDAERLEQYSRENEQQLLKIMADSDVRIERKEYGEVFMMLCQWEAWLLDEVKLIDAFFEIIGRNLTEKSADALIPMLSEMLTIFSAASPEVYEKASVNVSRVLHRLLDLNRQDAAGPLLERIREGAPAFREAVLLNPEVAHSIMHAGDGQLIGWYKGLLKQMLIPSPGVSGFSSETWAEISNPLHLSRLSKFLSVLRPGGGELRDVLIHVVCNLYVSGVFIPDDRIFQREISAYLNSPAMQDDFLLNSLLLRKLPVFFNEVGAFGRIRDYSTEIDAWGNDTVLYFLRKQVHVNASNYNIRLLEEIVRSWTYNDPGMLKGEAPDDVLAGLNVSLVEQYSPVIRRVFGSLGVLKDSELHLEKLLAVSEADLSRRIEAAGGPDEARSKVLLICKIYREVVKKYALAGEGEEQSDPLSALSSYITSLVSLKQRVISPEKTEAAESLFFKRHIAFGIPSVLGSYHEPKFDALGEMFRIEARARTILEKVISEIGIKKETFTSEDAKQWISVFGTVKELFDLHGLANFQADELAVMFKTNDLRLSQINDMLRIWQRELTWMVERFHRTFHDPLAAILKVFPKEELSEHLKHLSRDEAGFVDKAIDIIMRDIVNDVPGFVELDRMLADVVESFKTRVESGRDEEIALSGERQEYKEYFVLDELTDEDAIGLASVIGGKAKNLVYLRTRGLPVPHGAVFSAEYTAGYREYTKSREFQKALREAVRHIEGRTGKVFGGWENPLFLSVRSGSYISMPGILSSILYCGMNEETLEGFIRSSNDPRLAWDSFRRFIEHYGAVVLGIDSGVFEGIIGKVMKGGEFSRRNDLTVEHLEEIAGLYQAELSKRGLGIPDDAYEQLRHAAGAVYRSWDAERALQFRKAMDVSPYWGTSVTVMEMISGNASGSGASVFFTRWPRTLDKKIYGETRERATGDDLAYGKLTNRPLAAGQSADTGESLEETDRGLFLMHEELARKIESAMGGLPQEVEATYVRKPDGQRVIYALQTRRMEFHRGFFRRFQDICRMESNIIGRGTGVNGGALSGVAALSSSLERIRHLRRESGLPVILLRRSASTDDVSLMPEVDGIITAAGGAASHAAILAQKFDLTAVVGCSDMSMGTDERGEFFAQIGPYTVNDGSFISMDGSTGLVFSGICLFTVP